jgi:hypothetical protein
MPQTLSVTVLKSLSPMISGPRVPDARSTDR